MKIKNGYYKYIIREISVEIKTGKTPPSFEEVYYTNGNIDWYTPADIGSSSILNTSSKKITQAALDKKVAFTYKPNTVLITCIGEIGRVGILSNSSSSNQQITGILVNEKIVSHKYFYYWLKRNQNLLKHYSNYAVIPILNNSILENIPIYLPGLEIQNKTVSQLDLIQLFIDKRRQTIDLLDNIIQATFLSMFNEPLKKSNKIKKESLHNLGDWQSGGTPPRNKPEYFEGDISWYSSGELNEIFISKSKEKITKEALKKTSAKKVEKGSLLLGMYDTAALKSSITTIEASCNQAIAFAKLNENLCNTLYVYFAIQNVKKFYLSQRLGARQQNLNLTAIKNIEILLPEISKQNDFAKIISEILKQKVKLQNSLNILESLFNSLLQDVFNEKEIVNEKDLFEDLVKTFVEEDYLADKNRILYLITSLNENKFKDVETYILARNRAFGFLKTNTIKQVYNEELEKIELQISEK